MKDLISLSKVIRKCFEDIRYNSDIVAELNFYNKKFVSIFDKKDFTKKCSEYSSHLSIGIACVIQTICWNRISPTSFFIYKNIVLQGLRHLMYGLKTYESKWLKGECAFWLAICLVKNEKMVNDLVCDALYLMKKPVTCNSIYKMRIYIIEYLFGFIITINNETSTWEPNFNENNGFNFDVLNQYHQDWGEQGLDIIHKEDDFNILDFDKISEFAFDSLYNSLTTATNV